jgi:hypothetical protein
MSYWASVIVVAMTGVNVAQAIELKVMAASAVKEAYLELVSDFENSSGNKVITIWGARKDLPRGSVAAKWSISSLSLLPTSTN